MMFFQCSLGRPCLADQIVLLPFAFVLLGVRKGLELHERKRSLEQDHWLL